MSRITAIVALVLAISLSGEPITRACTNAPAAEASPKPPNVVLVVADDLDVALFDRLDRLPKLPGGRQFDKAFVTTPLCCPSKVSILRGQFAHSHGVHHNDPPQGGQARARELGIESCTLATWLDDAGYETAFFGRYLVGYGGRDTDPSYVPPGWDHWAARVSTVGHGYVDAEFSIGGVRRTLPGNIDVQALSFTRRVIADAGDRPYFIMIATMAPHWPWPGGTEQPRRPHPDHAAGGGSGGAAAERGGN